MAMSRDSRAPDLGTPDMLGNETFFAELRAREFARLDATNQAYLDYTGSGLYGASQLKWHHDWLAREVLGNPHSDNRPSALADAAVERVRARIHDFFGASRDDYEVIFTGNASGAMKLVAEAFPFTAESRFVMAVDNHNSIGGMRAWAKRAGAEIAYLPLDAELRLERPLEYLGWGGGGGSGLRGESGLPGEAGPRGESGLLGEPGPRGLPAGGRSLFAYPAQSNFSGVKHPLELVRAAQERGFRVFLDVAAYAPTNPLDLDAIGPDFVGISFYKLFGFPTSVGALIARREALAELERPWYAGGTVDYVSLQNDRHQLRRGGGAFEDGTLDFLGIAALEPGFDLLESVGMERLRTRVSSLTAALLAELERFGERLVIYGPRGTEARGGTVSFNLLEAGVGGVGVAGGAGGAGVAGAGGVVGAGAGAAGTAGGRVLPYEAIEGAGREAGVAIRGGCFCNPGVGEIALGIGRGEMERCLDATADDFSMARLRDCLGPGRAVGALRASLGIASNQDDIARLGALIETVLG